MATRTIANGGGNWTSTGTWVEGLVPTASDDVAATATSGNVTIDGAAVARSVDLTGYLGTLTHNSGVALSIGTSSLPASNVALFLPTTMTYTLGSATTSEIIFVATVATGTVTTNAKTLGNVTFGGAAGGWSLADAMTCGVLAFTKGTFTANNKNVTARQVSFSGALARNVTGGSGTWTLTTTGTVWSSSAVTNLTFDFSATTITCTQGNAVTKTFTPGTGQSFGALTYTAASAAAGTLAITDTCTIATLTVTTTATFAKTLTITAGKTVTVTTLTLSGAPGAALTINTTAAGSAATLSVAAGTVRANHASIKDSTVSGGATFQAYDSVSVSGNTGWSFVPAKTASLCGVGT